MKELITIKFNTLESNDYHILYFTTLLLIDNAKLLIILD